ncbi:MAG: hypothetical protein ACR2G2_12345 [Pseudonocardia sp.]
MSGDPTASTPTDQDPSDPAQLVTTAPVTTGEIAEFLRHLTHLRVSGRSDDPAARAAFMARKTELFTRLATDPLTPTSTPTTERRTS